MRKLHECDLDAGQPSLVVTYGNTTRKHRPLDRDLIVLGRGRGCDLALASPEIAPIHCLLARGPTGWTIRDCGSRSGTRVNGEPVDETVLHDGDVVQVGPFCFRAYLPAQPVPAADDGATHRLWRSRRNLALLGLALRRRLHLERQGHQQQLEQMARTVQERLREYEDRGAQLAEAERELSEDRAILDQEFRTLQERVVQAEQELTRQQAEVEAEMRARRQQLQKSCQQREESHTDRLQTVPPDGALAGEARRLELRRQELGHFARHLQRLSSRLRPGERAASGERGT